MSIKSLNNEDVHRLTSGQVIIDLPSVLKELIENSLDAHATKIEICFNDYGLNSIEVVDNGDGIDKSDFKTIALNHHTSKLSTFEDVSNVKTLGFRGEAISSLCAISNLTIITTNSPPKASTLTFNKFGELMNEKICSRPKGTTVSITDLFHNLPVRRKDLIKNIKREFSKTLSLITNYIIISEGVKFTVTNINKKGKKQTLLNSQGSNSLKDNLLDVFGSNALFGLIPMDLILDLNDRKQKLKVGNHNTDYSIKISGLISKSSFGFGRPINVRQFWFINKRPVSLPKFSKLVNEVYKTYNHLQFPDLVLNLEMNTEFLDVNVTPDKRTILIHNESDVIEEFRERLVEFFDSLDLSIPRSDTTQRGIDTFTKKRKMDVEEEEEVRPSLKKRGFAYNENNDNDNDNEEIDDDEKEEDDNVEKNVEPEDLGDDDAVDVEDTHESDRDDDQLEESVVPQSIRQSSTIPTSIDDDDRSDRQSLFSQLSEEDEEGVEVDEPEITPKPRPAIRQTRSKLINLRDLSSFANGASQLNSSPPSKKMTQPTLERVVMRIGGKEVSHEAYMRNESLSFDKCHCDDDAHDHEKPNDQDLEEEGEERVSNGEEEGEEQVSNVEDEVINLDQTDSSLNYETTMKIPTKFSIPLTSTSQTDDTKIKFDNIEDQDESEQLLTLTVSKNDFNKMRIIGQFNLGFILVMRDGKDLFIVDQHASDEKYNFEDLQKNTVIESQKLISMYHTDLSPMDELVVLDNIPTFEKSGFKLFINEDSMEGLRVSIEALPMSKKTIFDVSDFYEFVHLVKENPNNPNVKCSKIRSMLAMRACRKSIMVGKPLTMKAMTKVVRNLGTLDKPWNCPHGRPTMRHLMELKNWKNFNDDYEI